MESKEFFIMSILIWCVIGGLFLAACYRLRWTFWDDDDHVTPMGVIVFWPLMALVLAYVALSHAGDRVTRLIDRLAKRAGGL